MKVYTAVGYIEADDLVVRDIITWTDNSRETATEWRLNGELVRRDVHINALRPVESQAVQGNI